MRAKDFLIWHRDERNCCPTSKEGSCLGKPSNGELRRWLLNGSVLINRRTPGPLEPVVWPINELIFFPTSARSRTTIRAQ